MRCFPTTFLFFASFAPLIAQDGEEPRALPAGPAIEYVDAFPAQAGFDRPLFVAFTATDPGNSYVVTQPGHVFAIARDGKSAARHVFLDMSQRVFLDNWEEGLLGFAFDPAYAENGHVWTYWSEKIEVRKGVMGNGKEAKSNRQSVVSRFTAKKGEAGAVVDLATELRVLEIFQPFGNHNGGTIEFGPDQMLYIALGDGGAANDPYGNSQSLTTLLGKVLRIDVRAASKDKPFAIPADNPFVGKPEALGEIWCYGVRNPWRITFDRETGDLWCGDVGQNRLEEVDRLVKGGNYGWNTMEAGELFNKKATPSSDMIAPVASYPRSDGQSITGGYVYRGKAMPSLRGWFIYGDFQTLRMWACREDRVSGKHEVVTMATAKQQVSSFAEEPDGELLLTGFEAKRSGRVWRLVPAGK